MVVVRLDVTDPQSIQDAIDKALAQFGHIDVVVNNAGYALIGVFESATPTQILEQYAVNVFGLMNVTKVILPGMRSRQSGTIVNVSSFGGICIPLK